MGRSESYLGSKSVIRAFCAIELPDTRRDQLAQAAGTLKEAGLHSGIVIPENLHLTLRFLGEVADDLLVEIQTHLERICASEQPFTLSFTGIDAFPDWKRPAAVYIGVEPLSGPLARAQSAVDEACRDIGLPADTRAYKPHITLARLKDPSWGKRALSCKAVLDTLVGETFLVSGITLFESKTRPSGSLYRPLWRGSFSK